MKKFLFMIVPINSTYFPSLAIPSLAAQLRHIGCDVSVMDLSLDFIKKVYTKPYLKEAFTKAESQYKDLIKTKESFYGKKDCYENKLLSYKYDMLNDFFTQHREIGENVPEYIEKALKIVKDPKLFYNPQLIKFANDVFQYANKIACLPYIPFDFYRMEMTYFEDACRIILNKDQNMFFSYFESQIEKVKELNPAYIGISITFVQQVIPGLTLAYLLKKHTNAHISIGGDHISRLIEYIPNYKDFFDDFVDSVSYGEGENVIVDLARHINGEIDISEVPQLLYKDKKTGEIKTTPMGKPVILSRVQPPDYSDYDMDDYLFPVRALPLQIQRGCYWNKCAFCDFSVEKKPIAKQMSALMDELRDNKEKYNVSNYFIIDEAIHPKILNKFVDALIENKLDCRFTTYLRLEKEINYKLLKKMYKAGFRSVSWGLETASDRLLKLINKGNEIKTSIKILKDTQKANICSRLYLLIRFPSATAEEDMKTFYFIKKYEKYIQHFLFSKFKPTLDSRVYRRPDDYCIELEKDKLNTRISVEVEFTDKRGMSEEDKEIIYDKFLNYQQKEKFKYFFDAYYFILYAFKYDLATLRKLLLNKESKLSKIKNYFKYK